MGNNNMGNKIRIYQGDAIEIIGIPIIIITGFSNYYGKLTSEYFI